jgi:WD40 repeat protein
MKTSKPLTDSSSEVLRQTIAQDLSFVPYRPNILANAHKENQIFDSYYLKYRIYFLSCKAQNKELIFQSKGDRRSEYLYYRELILSKKYPERNQSNRPTKEDEVTSRFSRPSSRSHSRHTSAGSSSDLNEAREERVDKEKKVEDEKRKRERMKLNLPGGGKVSEVYAFAGMHCILSHHTRAVTTVKFAHDSKDLLCIASSDKTLTVVSLLSTPPTVIATLKGHSNIITDAEWSATNDFIASVSLDRTLRVWTTKTWEALKLILDDAPLFSVRFHPLNNNILLVGNANAMLKVYNFSTGKCVQTINVGAVPKSLVFNSTGDVLFVGDSDGWIRWYAYDVVFHCSYRGQQKISERRAVNSLKFRRYHTSLPHGEWPSLLANTTDNTLRLFRVVEGLDISGDRKRRPQTSRQSLDLSPSQYFATTPAQTRLELEAQYSVNNASAVVRSCFCPLLSMRTIGCVVTGSEDGTVYVLSYPAVGSSSVTNNDTSWRIDTDSRRQSLDIKNKSKQNASSVSKMQVVNQLHGHSTAVLDVDWCYDELFLSSGDASGT